MPSCKISSPALSCLPLIMARYVFPNALPALRCECRSGNMTLGSQALFCYSLAVTWARHLASIKGTDLFQHSALSPHSLFLAKPPAHWLRYFHSLILWLHWDLESTGFSTFSISACPLLTRLLSSFREFWGETARNCLLVRAVEWKEGGGGGF